MKRVLDSTPLYDAVATMDTITLIRSAIRSLLSVADEALEGELRDVLVRAAMTTPRPPSLRSTGTMPVRARSSSTRGLETLLPA